MKRFIYLFLGLFLLASNLYAAEDLKPYLIENPDGTIAIFYFNETSGDTVENALKKSGVTPEQTVTKISYDDMPQDGTNLSLWKRNFGSGKKIVVDQSKKAKHDSDLEKKNQDIQSVISALKTLGLNEKQIKILASSDFKRTAEKLPEQ